MEERQDQPDHAVHDAGQSAAPTPGAGPDDALFHHEFEDAVIDSMDDFPGEPPAGPPAGSDAAIPEAKKPPRAHPYRNEKSGSEEKQVDGRRVAGVVLGTGAIMAIVGIYLQTQLGYISNDATNHPEWETWTNIPLFVGLALLAFALVKKNWSHGMAMAGWTVFGAYWALTSRDLLVREAQDYVNYIFAIAGVFLCIWLAYHHWLDKVRGVRDTAARFLQVAVVIAAGSYFLIDKIVFLRLWLINIVSGHTRDMLGWFGQGADKGLVFRTDVTDNKSPTTFFYPDLYCNANRSDPVGEYCKTLPPEQQFVLTYPEPAGSFWQEWLLYAPDGDLAIVPVSIILACTAIQSIMLFVGLFAGTQATLKKKVYASLLVGGTVYVLNLVRNTGIIWFYGQGDASFWVMHNAIGKGGSLLAMVGIAVMMFRYFPEFLQALIRVLDLIDRDGPLERTLRIGRRRPDS